MDREAKLQELNQLRAKVQFLEQELAQDLHQATWPPKQETYTAYQVLAGSVLGMVGALASLLFNIVGSLLFLPAEQGPLWLIRVYLTFPFGDAVIPEGTEQLTPQMMNLALAMGCTLYLLTGMIMGIPVNLVLSRWFSHSSFATRFLVATGLGLALWLLNFYGILSWLQPLLFGGSWIIKLTPWWVGALTHLVFAWTMLFLAPFGGFVAYKHPAEAQ